MRARYVIWIYGIVLMLGLLVGVLVYAELRFVSGSMQEVLTRYGANLIEVERLRLSRERRGRIARVFTITGEPRLLDEIDRADEQFDLAFSHLRSTVQDPQSRELLAQIERNMEEEHTAAPAPDFVPGRPVPVAELERYEAELRPFIIEMDRLLDALVNRQTALFRNAQEETVARTQRGVQHVALVAVAALLVSLGLTVAFVRAMRLLERSQAELLQQNEDLDAFAGRVAHDLRNVLAPLSLVAARLERVADDPARVRQTAQRLQRVGQRAEGIVGSLLVFARAGRPSGERNQSSVREVVSAVIEDLAPNVQAAGAVVDVDVDEVQVACAAPLLHTALVNVVGNALKFVDGRPERRVRVSTLSHDEWCDIRVADTGPGIARDAQEGIFLPFHRAPGTTAPGSGIGLATVKRIVQAHGGVVLVDSDVGRGACFTLRLPLAPEAAPEPPAPPETPERPSVH